jgi:hypothetical protein
MIESELICALCIFPAMFSYALHLRSIEVWLKETGDVQMVRLMRARVGSVPPRHAVRQSRPRSRARHEPHVKDTTAMDSSTALCWPDNSFSLLVGSRSRSRSTRSTPHKPA